MENIENTAMQEAQEISTESESTQDAFLDGWDDDGQAVSAEESGDHTAETGENGNEAAQSAETGTQTPEAQSAGPESTPAAAQETTVIPTDAPEKTWVLRHMDEQRVVTEAEMTTLAQKGMDYDRIRSKYDESKPAMEMLKGFAAKAGMSVPDYIAHLRTEAKLAGGMSEAEAKRSVELEDREAAVSAREAEQQAAREEAQREAAGRDAEASRRKADIEEFTREYPDAAKDPKSIPREVWNAVAAGSRLTVAYAKYAAAQARAEAESARSAKAAMEQNGRNAERSTGSMQSAGQSKATRDPFLEGWGD